MGFSFRAEMRREEAKRFSRFRFRQYSSVSSSPFWLQKLSQPSGDTRTVSFPLVKVIRVPV